MEKQNRVDYYEDFFKSQRDKNEEVQNSIIKIEKNTKSTDSKTKWILFWTIVIVILTTLILVR